MQLRSMSRDFQCMHRPGVVGRSNACSSRAGRTYEVRGQTDKRIHGTAYCRPTVKPPHMGRHNEQMYTRPHEYSTAGRMQTSQSCYFAQTPAPISLHRCSGTADGSPQNAQYLYSGNGLMNGMRRKAANHSRGIELKGKMGLRGSRNGGVQAWPGTGRHVS